MIGARGTTLFVGGISIRMLLAKHDERGAGRKAALSDISIRMLLAKHDCAGMWRTVEHMDFNPHASCEA